VAERGDFRINFRGTCFLESEYIENKVPSQVSFTIILGHPCEILTKQREENQMETTKYQKCNDRLPKILLNNFDRTIPSILGMA
jgi:hypothetical protein